MNVEMILSAVLGGLTALLTRAFFELIDVRRRASTSRTTITLQLSSFYYEYRSELEALILAREKSPALIWWPPLTKTQGRIIEMQMKVWHSFPDRKIRASIVRLIDRLRKIQGLLSAESAPNLNTAKSALSWADEQYEELLKLLASKASIPWRDRRRLVFVRWGKVTPEDTRQMSFEDNPPPWEFGLIFEGGPDRFSAECINRTQETFGKRFSKMRCKVHDQPVHIKIGYLSNLGVIACCNEFGKQMEKLLNIELARQAKDQKTE